MSEALRFVESDGIITGWDFSTGAVKCLAFDLQGQAFELEDAGFLARVWQHEFDHLEGVLITDRMNPRDRLANRKTLKEMRLDFEEDSER